MDEPQIIKHLITLIFHKFPSASPLMHRYLGTTDQHGFSAYEVVVAGWLVFSVVPAFRKTANSSAMLHFWFCF